MVQTRSATRAIHGVKNRMPTAKEMASLARNKKGKFYTGRLLNEWTRKTKGGTTIRVGLVGNMGGCRYPKTKGRKGTCVFGEEEMEAIRKYYPMKRRKLTAAEKKARAKVRSYN